MGRSLKTALFREKGKCANRHMRKLPPMRNRRTLQTSVVAAVGAVSRGGVVAAVIVVAIVGFVLRLLLCLLVGLLLSLFLSLLGGICLAAIVLIASELRKIVLRAMAKR